MNRKAIVNQYQRILFILLFGLTSLLVSLQVQAQTTDVATSENTNQKLSGRLLNDAVLYTGLRWNLGVGYNLNVFRFQQSLSWYEFYGSGLQVIRRPYENLVVQGNGVSNLLIFEALDDPFEPGNQTPYDVSIRTLTVNDATVWLFDSVDEDPIDLRFRSIIAGESKKASVTLNNGTLDTGTRSLIADADMDMTFHSMTGDNALMNMSVNPVGKSLHFQVDPGTSLMKSFASGSEVRYRSPSSLLVDDATFNIAGNGAKMNLEMNSDGVNGLKVINGGVLKLGGTGFSDRFEYVSNLPQDGIQIIGSRLELETVTTLEGYLLLDGAAVETGASARLVGDELDVQGNTLITSVGGVAHQYTNLQGTGDGTLTLVGGEYEFANFFFLTNVALVLGEPGGGNAPMVSVLDSSPYAPTLNKGLSGVGTLKVLNTAKSARVPSGAAVSPGHSVGELTVVGGMSFENGSTLAMEIDAASIVAQPIGGSDTLVFNTALPGQTGMFDVQAGSQMTVNILNDQVLPAGTRAVLASYPDSDTWSGVSFSGFPDGHVVVLGQNHWLVQYNDVFIDGLPQRALTLTVADPIASVSPTHLDFSSPTDILSDAQTVTVTNAGLDTLIVSGYQVFGASFTISGDSCIGVSLAPAASCSFTVRFFSTTAGEFTGAITVQSNAGGQPPGLTMFGEAIAPNTAPEATVNPLNIDFAQQTEGTLSALETVTVSNTGTDTLEVSGYQLSGTAFVLRNDTCVSHLIAPGESCQFEVGFLPPADGDFAESVIINSNAASPVTVALTGMGELRVPEPKPAVPVPVNNRVLLLLLVLGMAALGARAYRYRKIKC